jgi:hypothetical protein
LTRLQGNPEQACDDSSKIRVGAFEDKGEEKRLRLETKLEDTAIRLTVIIEREQL